MNYKVIAESGLKIRSGPGTEYDEIGLLSKGEVIISPDLNGFVPVLLEDDTFGWIAKQYIEESIEADHAIEAVETSVVRVDLPLFQNELASKFGYPKERAGYLTTIDLKDFAQYLGHVKDYEGNPWSCRIYGHELMVNPLRRAFGYLCDRGFAGELRTYDGCFNIRRMTGSNSYSVHSWGLAVDFNAAQNPYGGEITFTDDFIKCFADAGFEAGALWQTPDGMHFQVPWTRDWRQSDEELRPKL